jgi:hypothetical protein
MRETGLPADGAIRPQRAASPSVLLPPLGTGGDGHCGGPAVCKGDGQTGRASRHAVGTGAEPIARQVEERFGTHGRYLSAFYHAGEFLAAAERAIGVDEAVAGARLDTRETRLQPTSCANEVILTLAASREPVTVADSRAMIRRGHRY